MLRECSIHGVVKHHRNKGEAFYRCTSCVGVSVAKSRRKSKELVIAEFGGRCIRCGYDESPAGLCFHHKDPATKKFGIGSGPVRSRADMMEEAKKCVLLCLNCHASLHYGTWHLSD